MTPVVPHATIRRERPPAAAEDVADAVAELLDQVVIRPEWTAYRNVTRRGQQHRHAERRAATRYDPGLLWQLGSVSGRVAQVWARVDLLQAHPVHGERRVGHRVVRAACVGSAVVGASVPSGSPGWDADGALSPAGGGVFESAEPVTAALLLADEIASQIAQVHTAACRAAGHTSARTGAGGRLRELVYVAGLLEDQGDSAAARRVAGWARAWATRCRVLLGYDARTIELADRWCCPDCGGALRTRADDESTVRCAGLGVVAGPAAEGELWPVVAGPCGSQWGKGQWIQLMRRQRPR